ncbi:MAG: hypothetical protein JNL59_05645 [Chitinophagaceae bacterium]|nr:hypothetical protein [Chitinophagaceae bacterium]
MAIAFFGSSILSAYRNGAATYYRGVIKALYEKGYRTVFYQPDLPERRPYGDIKKPEWGTGENLQSNIFRSVPDARRGFYNRYHN